ncbi:hypothetical protein [Paenibacillus oleatilyticus]
MAVSPHAHAKIISIDSSEALQIPGVKAVITSSPSGQEFLLTGRIPW